MNHDEAKALIKDAGLYNSADFYRMQTSFSIALGLLDQPHQILADVLIHGSDEAKAMLEDALNAGYVVNTSTSDIPVYDVVDIEESGAPYYFRSHIAMQIAYPALYAEYFGEYVWTYSHPKMLKLVDLCVSCLTNDEHPSDYYGEHEITDKPVKPEKKLDHSYKAWVDACQEYKRELKRLWDEYLERCRIKKEAMAQWKDWRQSELNRLREEMAKVSEAYKEAAKAYDDGISDIKSQHSELKAKGKPKRDQF